MSNSNERCFLNNYQWLLLYFLCKTNNCVATVYQFLARFCFCDKFTCVSAGELVLFPSFLFWGEIFLSAPWGFFFSTAQFVFLPLCLRALVSFWHLFANKPNQNYLYINKARSRLKAVIVAKKNCPILFPATPQNANPPLNPSIQASLCAASRFDVFVFVFVRMGEGEEGRKCTSPGCERGFRPRGDGHTGASVLCVCR